LSRNKKQEQKVKQSQIRAFLFLGCALIYFILGQAMVAKYEVYPFAKACIFNSQKKNDQQQDWQAKISQITTGTPANQKNTTIEEKAHFSKTDSQINVKVDFFESSPDQEATCYFYYMGNNEFSKPFLVGTDKKITKGTPEETLVFELHSTGNQWQLEGDFRAIISIPSSGIKQERNFSVL
jgi:hypothetical protein